VPIYIVRWTSPSARVGRRLLLLAILLAVWAVEPARCSAAKGSRATVRRIGKIQGDLARKLRRQVRVARLYAGERSPLLVQGARLGGLNEAQKAEIVATYRAGFTIVVHEATLGDIRALHAIIGEGVTYRSRDTGLVMAYSLRLVDHVPTATLLTKVNASPLETQHGTPDWVGMEDEAMALGRAVERMMGELREPPRPGEPGALRDPNQEVNWLSAPIQTTVFALNSPQGVYNTEVNVFALYRCLDQTDHYAVTAEADWTATNAKWQGVTSDTPNPSLYKNGRGQLVMKWQDNRTYCSSGGYYAAWDDICRYINYPLSYELRMVPLAETPVVQLDAAPGATQGEQTTYSSGFSFSIGGTVNVSSVGPGGGIAAGAAWTNIVQTTVPPLIVEVGNTGNEGVFWKFKYCTTGLEPDPGTNCTSHVQMVKDVCQAQLGDDSGTNPQQGQTPLGKFSDAVQSAHWQASSTERVGDTFDIDVGFVAAIATTTAHLGSGSVTGPDPIAGCNVFGCACVSTTQVDPVGASFTFEIPYPATKCS
jgi:hypothetical protein